MNEMKRVLALLLCFVMLVGYVPAGAFAAEADVTAPSVEEIIATEVTAEAEDAQVFSLGSVSAAAASDEDELDSIDDAMAEALAYIHALTIDNKDNDPETVVKDFGTHFTWDNEKREDSKSYLYDWSYYNGVVFEGLEYLYEVTGEEKYKSYVMEYMSSLIASNGTWATCSDNSSKQCAGYNSTHGADCYKTASLLLDAYEMSGDKRYLTVAKTLYEDLDAAANTYSLPNAGNNFRHTWASDPSPDLWLDGLYMILPFRAEYAKYTNDTEELDLIVSRLQWVSDKMYNSTKKLFYHAADSATSNSGNYWLRAIGWYAAAIVDVMDSMEGQNLETMKTQLKKLVEGMVACQSSVNGMWLNNMAAAQSSSNPYETSGTALVCYAIMKAVNEGWLDEEYADDAILAFRGICTQKLANNNLTDICFKGAPGSSNSTFYDNEGKGVGPFIMFYAELVEYFAEDGDAEEPEEEETIVTLTHDYANGDQFVATGLGLTSMEIVLDETTDYSAIFDTNKAYGAYSITLGNFTEGKTVELTMGISGVLEEGLVVYKVEADGTLTEITEVEFFRNAILPEHLYATFDITSNGTYAMGTRNEAIPADAVLTGIEIVAAPEKHDYFKEEANAEGNLALDITGLVVEATYSNGTKTVTKEIYWNEFGQLENGYALSFDMTQVGEQEVAVSYTYRGVTATAGFGIEIFERVVQDETVPGIKLELKVPANVTAKIQENSQTAFVKAALENIVTAYIAYDFDLTNYTQGDEVEITMPLPAGEGTGVVYYIPDNGEAAVLVSGATDNGDGTITFTTNHFSTYASGRVAPATGNGTLAGGTTYTLKTSGNIDPNKKYLIVSANSNTGYALTNNNGTADRTSVTITNGTITVADDTNIAWTFNNGAISNNDRYVYPDSGLSLDTTRRTLTISGQGNGAYRIYRIVEGNMWDSYYYLRYNNGWTASQAWRESDVRSVYLYELTSSSTGEAVTFSVNPGSADLKVGDTLTLTGNAKVGTTEYDLSKCTVNWATSARNIATVSNGTITAVSAGSANITAELTHVNGTPLKESITLTIPITVSDYVYTFSVSPESVSLKLSDNNKKTATLTPTVTVDGAAVNAANCTITWSSNDENVATVAANGTVTGVAEGQTVVTATLTRVNNKSLSAPITVTIPVTVMDKEIVSISLSSNDGYIVRNRHQIKDEHGNPIQINVTYDNGEKATVDLTLDMLVGRYDVSTLGEYPNLTVTYLTKELESFTLHVTENPGNNFPEYPHAGAVDVNKVAGDVSQFQNTGVAEIQLSTSGIPLKRGVDVVLVADISNSMAWEAGTTGTSDATKIAARVEDTKWYDLTQSAAAFANILLTPDKEGNESENTISFVTFGGYDAQRNNNASSYSTYADATQTHFTSVKDAATVNSKIGAISIIGRSSNNSVTYTISGMANGNGTAQGGTNYDYAFLETASAIKQIKAEYARVNDGKSYDESGREIYVVFMTDGAPDHYNQLYYKSRSTSQFDYYAVYKNDDDAIAEYFASATLPTFNSFVKRQSNGGYYLPTADVSNENWIKWLQTDSLAAAEYVADMDCVNSITAIGFDLPNGAFGTFNFSEEILEGMLQDLAGEDSCEVMTTENATELNAFYVSLASQIKQAATNAYFVDQMGDSFDLQMASSVTKFADTENPVKVVLNPAPKITVSSYSIYTKADADAGTITADKIGTRYGSPVVMETVTFNDAGTEAYSNGGSTNIINADGVICANTFWYNTTGVDKSITVNGKTVVLPAETFYWNIGTVSEHEFVLSYYVYLNGASEGTAPAGTYKTNNYATLHYTNHIENDVSQDVQSPNLAWKSASVYYAFYLVDKDGNPVVNQATGQTGSFADAIKVSNKVFFKEVMLNSQGGATSSTLEVSATVIPDEYKAYDKSACYTVTVDSGQEHSGWVITKSTDKNTTYVTDYYGVEYSNALTETNKAYDYTSTTVWFAVEWKPQALPDTIVIDYGLPVDINVLGNDMFGDKGTLHAIGADIPPNEEGKYDYDFLESPADGFGEALALTYGDAKVNGAKVRYTPKTMAINGYDQFAYEVEYAGYDTENKVDQLQYFYNTVTVIPATTVYYEDTFEEVEVKNEDGTTTTTRNGIVYSDGWNPVTEDNAPINPTQQEDRPGQYGLPTVDANNVYGYDAIYANSAKYSLGNAMKVNVTEGNPATATFRFYGTGFDVISLTSSATGTISVKVCKVDDKGVASQTAEKHHIVDTYYGYEYDATNKEWVPATTNNSLYQVPVMKISGLTYGCYEVTIMAAWDKFFDHNTSDTGYDFYLDGIRIYNPAGDGVLNSTDEDGKPVQDTTIKDAYVADKEAYPEYRELRNLIITEEDFDALTAGDQKEGVIFIDHVSGTYSVDNYKTYGPNNELYLAEGQTIAFNLNLGNNGIFSGRTIADVQLAAKTADGKNVYLKMTQYNSDSLEIASSTGKIATATDRYYSIGNYVDKKGTTILSFSNVRPEGVTGDVGILSITNIKFTFTQPVQQNQNGNLQNVELASVREMVVEPLALFTVSRTTGDAVLAMLNAAEEEIPEPTVPEETVPEETVPETTVPEETEPEVTEPEETLDADLQVNIRNKNIKVGSSVVVKVTTSSDVDALTVNGKQITHYTENRRTGVRTWNINVKAEEAGDMDIVVTAYSAKGQALDTVVEQVTVTGKKASVVEQIVGIIIGVLLR